MGENIFSKAHKEQLDVSFVKSKHLEKTKFNLLKNFVFYFNCESSKIMFDYYLDSNLNVLEKTFHDLGKTFIVVNNQSISNKELEVLQYYFPSLEINNTDYNKSQTLLDYFKYSGKLQSGLIYYGAYQLNIIELPSTIILNTFDDYFDGFYKQIKNENSIKNDWLFSPIFYEPDEIEFDDDDIAEIQKVIDKLNEIRTKGNFIALLPLLEKHLQHQKLNDTKLSRLHIDQDYKIWLIDYDLEVKLSHLTKAIYFLFLLRDNKIDLSEFRHYKKELLKIYLSISNQENFDKMIQSVDLLIADKNAIYVHLSRIKSAFHKLVYKDIAEHYTVQGAKYEPKGISLDKSLTNIKEYKLIWFPQKPMTDADIANQNDALSL